jgi:hypothetical protein
MCHKKGRKNTDRFLSFERDRLGVHRTLLEEDIMTLLEKGMTIAVDGELVTLGSLIEYAASDKHLFVRWNATVVEDGRHVTYEEEPVTIIAKPQ